MEKLSGFTFKQGFSLAELTPYFTDQTPLLAQRNREKEPPTLVHLDDLVQTGFAFEEWC